MLELITWPCTFSTFLRGAVLVYVAAKTVKLVWTSTFVRSSLQNIPGPPPQSLVKGDSPSFSSLNIINKTLTGNLGQLFNPKGLRFHQNLVDTYGGMVKIYGFFGVSPDSAYLLNPSHEPPSLVLGRAIVCFGPQGSPTYCSQRARCLRGNIGIP